VGLRDDDSVYTVEILGYQTEAHALELAQQCADRWGGAKVNLIRVPFVHTSSAPWSDEQEIFIRQILPVRIKS
jgi:hypothetical protein